MKIRTPVRVLACVAAFAFAGVAFAAGSTSETMDIEIRTAAGTEKLSLSDLAPGETRQVYSEAGTLVTATRTADLLVIDIGGDKTEIRMLDPTAQGEGAHHVWLEKDSEGDGKRTVRIHAEHADSVAVFHADDAAVGERKIVVMRGHDADGADSLDTELIDLLGADADAADGKRVMVKRRVTSEAPGND